MPLTLPRAVLHRKLSGLKQHITANTKENRTVLGVPVVVTDNLIQLTKLRQRFGVQRLWLYGSATTASFGNESDLDFAVEFSLTTLGTIE